MTVSLDSRIALIGTGALWAPIALRLYDKGYDVVVSSPEKEEATHLIDNGVAWADTVREAVRDAVVVITMMGDPGEVEDVYLGEDGALAGAEEHAYLIDLSTSTPRLAREIHAIAAVNDLHAIDAPLIGDVAAALTGTLIVLVGAEGDDRNHLLPLLTDIGENVMDMGLPGMGQTAKAVDQIAQANALMGTIEAVAFAVNAGLDPTKVLTTLLAGEGGSRAFARYGTAIVEQDFAGDFTVEEFMKDLAIALETADELELTLPGLETAYQLYDLLAAVGGSDKGIQALYLIYADEALCAEHGLDWARAQSLVDGHAHEHDHIHDDECGCDCGHDHGVGRQSDKDDSEGSVSPMGSFFSSN